jgi:hypothetical protein
VDFDLSWAVLALDFWEPGRRRGLACAPSWRALMIYRSSVVVVVVVVKVIFKKFVLVSQARKHLY